MGRRIVEDKKISLDLYVQKSLWIEGDKHLTQDVCTKVLEELNKENFTEGSTVMVTVDLTDGIISIV